MANALNNRTWRIDTAGATVLWPDNLEVRAVHWFNAVNAGDKAQIKDRDGKLMWEAVSAGANFDQFDLLRQWWRGFAVPTLDSGILYVELS